MSEQEGHLAMVETTDFPWPPLADGGPMPVWDGSAFHVGATTRRVLEYSRDETAWDARLTGFHEQTASSDHPIDVASRRAALEGLRSRVSPDARVILEVGTSSGFLLPSIRAAFPRALVIGSDAFSEALLALADRRPGFPLLQFDLTRCPLPEGSVDAVVALNVLEHIRDDRVALAQVRRVLKPGGVAYLEVPAGPWLYDIYDEMLRHHRRYGASAFRRMARDCGLRVEWFSHLGCLVFPLFAAVKIRNRRRLAEAAELKAARVARSITGSRGSRALEWAFAAEAQLGRLVRFPFGIRCVCVLRKAV